MKTYSESRAEVKKMLKESNINAHEFMRIAKDLCTCQTCEYFVQHYDGDGNWVAFGHCIKGNAPRARQPYQTCCGSWDVRGDTE